MPPCKKNLCLFQQYNARPVCCTANSRSETQPQHYLFCFLFRAPKPKYLFLTDGTEHVTDAKKPTSIYAMADNNTSVCTARNQPLREFIAATL